MTTAGFIIAAVVVFIVCAVLGGIAASIWIDHRSDNN